MTSLLPHLTLTLTLTLSLTLGPEGIGAFQPAPGSKASSNDGKNPKMTGGRHHLRGARLEGLNLEGGDLAGLNLTAITVDEVIAWQKDLQVALRKARGGVMTGSSSYLHQDTQALTGEARVAALKAQYNFSNKAGSLNSSNLRNTNFKVADLKGVSFIGADLQNSDFSAAELNNCSFVRADVTGADFKDAKLPLADFAGAVGLGAAKWGPDLERLRDVSGLSQLHT